jgi:hypothetical protein
MYDSIMAFEVKLRLVKTDYNCVTLFTFHTWNLLDTIYSESIQQNSQSNICVDKISNDSMTSNLWNQNVCSLL